MSNQLKYRLPLQGRIEIFNPVDGEPRITHARIDPLPHSLLQMLKDNRIERFFERQFASASEIQTFWGLLLQQYISVNSSLCPRREFVSLSEPQPFVVQIPPAIQPSPRLPEHYGLDEYYAVQDDYLADAEGNVDVAAEVGRYLDETHKSNTAKLPFTPRDETDGVDDLLKEMDALLQEKPPE